MVVPTYREVENLPDLIERLGAVRRSHCLDLDLLIVDDDSRDGTRELIARRQESWVGLVVRTSGRGLSSAVVEGLGRARGGILVVMDADLSHPPEQIPEMLDALELGHDFVVGSRYVEGGSTSGDWSTFRRLNSRVATWLARPLSAARDPMSGFFALRRETFDRARSRVNPVGYKIGLELMVKCECRGICEVPIHFADRTRGQSKLGLREQVRYLEHLRRLLVFRYAPGKGSREPDSR